MKGIIGVCKNYFKKENIVRDGKNNIKIVPPQKFSPKEKKTAFFKMALGKSFWLWELIGESRITLTVNYPASTSISFAPLTIWSAKLWVPVINNDGSNRHHAKL